MSFSILKPVSLGSPDPGHFLNASRTLVDAGARSSRRNPTVSMASGSSLRSLETAVCCT